MAESHTMTATVRDCIRQMYAETASSVQQVFAEDQLNTILQLSQVKCCYGSDPINRVEGGYRLLDGTCWLAELCVGKTDAQASGIMTGTLLGSGNKVIGTFAQLELAGLFSTPDESVLDRLSLGESLAQQPSEHHAPSSPYFSQLRPARPA